MNARMLSALPAATCSRTAVSRSASSSPGMEKIEFNRFGLAAFELDARADSIEARLHDLGSRQRNRDPRAGWIRFHRKRPFRYDGRWCRTVAVAPDTDIHLAKPAARHQHRLVRRANRRGGLS